MALHTSQDDADQSTLRVNNRSAPSQPRAERSGGEPQQKPAPDQKQSPDAGKSGWRTFLANHRIAIIIAIVVVLAAIAGGVIWWLNARHYESTDDAFIDARQFSIAPKVAGYVVDVAVTDNQHVAQGSELLRIDDRDYRNALAQSQAQVQSAEAAIASVDAQIAGQQQQVTEAKAQVAQSQAALQFAQEEAARAQQLAQNGAGTVQRSQQASSTLRQAQADFARVQAAVSASDQQIVALKAQRASSVAALAQAKAARDQAQLNLSYTVVTAAQAGRVVHLSAAKGAFAQVGQSLTMFVPDEMWVTANFKETQVTDMRPGQPVDLRIDAYPGRTIHGHVASVQPGSGTAFSLLPAENATGNYVKVVQRIPVKIQFDQLPQDIVLGPGMSVVPWVKLR